MDPAGDSAGRAGPQTPAAHPAEKRLGLSFVVDSRHHGNGKLLFVWHPNSTCVATTGTSRVVHIFASNGQLVDQIVLPSPSVCSALAWDRSGSTLAVMQASSPQVVLWRIKTRETVLLDTNCKDLTFLSWSPSGALLALGTSKGALLVIETHTHRKRELANRKKRIVCGAWSPLDDSLLAFATEDRQVVLCAAGGDGETVDQLKAKARPHSLAFAGAPGSALSVNLEGRSLLLYHLGSEGRDGRAVELPFRPRHGTLARHSWLSDGRVLAGFSSGVMVVLSTDAHDFGREHVCGKFHEQLRDLAHCPETNVVATCGERCVKLVDGNDWSEIAAFVLDKESSILDSLEWADHGRILSVSSRSGCLYTFKLLRAAPDRSAHGACTWPHSAFTAAVRPLSPLELVAHIAMLALVLLVAGAWHLGVDIVDLVRAIAGISDFV